MAATTKNAIADAAGMRPFSQSDLHAFAGIEGAVFDARIADIEIDEIPAQLVLCDAQLGITYNGPNDELHAWAQDGSRYVRELVAAEVMKLSRENVLGFEDLAALGFEHVVGAAPASAVVPDITTLTRDQVDAALQAGGYSDNRLISVRYAYCRNPERTQAAYDISFEGEPDEGALASGRVFVRWDAAASRFVGEF